MSVIPTPINMPGPDASDHDWRAFLEHQLAGAVAALRSKDATEEACIQRLEVRYQSHHDNLKKTLDEIERRLGVGAERYALLRQHQVQVWALGIAATGEQLDHALDEQIEKAQKATA